MNEPKQEWICTPEQWRRYLEREVELAVLNIRATGSSALSSHETLVKAHRSINRGKSQ